MPEARNFSEILIREREKKKDQGTLYDIFICRHLQSHSR